MKVIGPKYCTERLARAALARDWHEYRTARHLPIARKAAARRVREAISRIRAYAWKRGASRRPWWEDAA